MPCRSQPQTTFLNPVLTSAAASIFIQLYLNPAAPISDPRSLLRVIPMVVFSSVALWCPQHSLFGNADASMKSSVLCGRDSLYRQVPVGEGADVARIIRHVWWPRHSASRLENSTSCTVRSFWSVQPSFRIRICRVVDTESPKHKFTHAHPVLSAEFCNSDWAQKLQLSPPQRGENSLTIRAFV